MEFTKKRFVLQTQNEIHHDARIKVVGIGGGGSNAVDYMIPELIEDVECYVANTDAQALAKSKTANKLQFGTSTTKGRGAGFNPQRGREAAMEDCQNFIDFLGEAEMVFITAGLGGGTGTGAAPVFARAIKELDPEILVVAVVTIPFSFEGARRMEYAQAGASELRDSVDSIITIANDKILLGDIPLSDAYGSANNVLLSAVRGISDLIVRTGFINVDFADVKTIMSEEGLVIMAHGSASGEDRAQKVAQSVLSHPLLEGIDLSNAQGLLVNVTASSNISANEYKQIGELIQNAASNAESIVSGLVFDDEVGDEIRVTIVASGLTLPEDGSLSVTENAEQHEELSIGEMRDEFDHLHMESEAAEEEAVTSPFIDEAEDDQEEYLLEMSHVPSILKNRGNLRPEKQLNGSAGT